MSDLPTRTLTDEYVHHLTTRIAGRLREGYDLSEALGETLRERAPVRLDLPQEGGGTSAFGWIVRMGLLAGVGLAANYAAQVFYGRNLADLVRSQLEGDPNGHEGGYAPIHGTSGAEMPDPAAPHGPRGSAFAAGPADAPTTSAGAPVGTPAPQTPPRTSSSTAAEATKPSSGTPDVKHTAGAGMPAPSGKSAEKSAETFEKKGGE